MITQNRDNYFLTSFFFVKKQLIDIKIIHHLINYRFFRLPILLSLNKRIKHMNMFGTKKESSTFLSRLQFKKSGPAHKADITYHEALLELYVDAYVVVNQETNDIVDYNDRMKSMFQLPPELDLKTFELTRIMMRYLAEDSDNKDLMMNRIPDYWQGEAGFITHLKEKFYAYIKSNIFYRDDTKFQIISIRNITEKKVAEQELKIYKANVENAAKAKARFLSSMSHELRTPLNGIIGTSNLVLMEPNLPEPVKKHINILRYSSEHMLGIINDILDFSKIDAGKLELKKQTFNLKECLENIIKSFEVQFHNKELEFIIVMPDDLDAVNVVSDEVKLSQIINNLLSNALKFTSDGSVTFTVTREHIDEHNTTFRFDVKDSGIGIPKDKQAEIFQGFAQVHAAELSRRFGGTGLGLTISERLVTKFGGRLEVESAIGEGARFFFSIPFENAKIKEVKTPKDNGFGSDITDTRGLRVLVVEDNEINASILISFLHKWGIQIKEAGNGIQALELIQYHKFDLVLMDLEMPEMDGYAAIKKIRETDRVTPVLAFTATLLENMDSLISDTGFNDYVLKPYRPAELKKKILMYAPHRKVDYV
jgi:signal transduction histidine kinase/CheY-like chemotaxis protein